MSLGPLLGSPSTPVSFTGSSGGGDPPPDKDPVIYGSGGGIQQKRNDQNEPIEGEYEIPDGVPVGAVMSVVVQSPDPAYTISTVTWAGGTGISNYDLRLPANSLEKQVATTNLVYGFIVDADVRTYTVTTSVAYENGAHGTSTLTFASVRPTVASLSVVRGGSQAAWLGPGPLISVGVAPSFLAEARTQTAGYGGTFMFLQVVTDTERSVKWQNGQVTQVSNNFAVANGEVFDGPLVDGPLVDGQVYYPFDYRDDTDFPDWRTDPNQSFPEAGFDPPLVEDAPVQRVLTSFQEVSASDHFSLYLMYQADWPADAAWVGLARLNWSWSKTASRDPAATQWTCDPAAELPPSSIAPPTGDAAFPIWVNTATAFRRYSFGVLKPTTGSA